MNDFDGPYNASNLPNQVAFAALKTDGSPSFESDWNSL
jgi:hypothetical protein